jgi:hypothetical protein
MVNVIYLIRLRLSGVILTSFSSFLAFPVFCEILRRTKGRDASRWGDSNLNLRERMDGMAGCSGHWEIIRSVWHTMLRFTFCHPNVGAENAGAGTGEIRFLYCW